MSRRVRRVPLFPVNVWPPFVDALTLVCATFVLLMIVALVAQRGLLARLRDREHDVDRLRADKERIERRLRALAPRGALEVSDGKVILQGEVLFATGSDALTATGKQLMTSLAPPLAQLLEAEPGQMVLVGGHTDDRPIVTRFPSNWELSTARALAVSRVLIGAGVPPARVMAAGFGEHHPRVANADDTSRRHNRRIEVAVVPLKAVSSR